MERLLRYDTLLCSSKLVYSTDIEKIEDFKNPHPIFLVSTPIYLKIQRLVQVDALHVSLLCPYSSSYTHQKLLFLRLGFFFLLKPEKYAFIFQIYKKIYSKDRKYAIPFPKCFSVFS